jgi:glycosyltransferase involved in cell wall biosynthesis
MRILHLSPVKAPEIGGMGSVAERYATWQREDGHEAVVRSSEDGLFRIGNASFMPQAYLLARRVDLVHVHYPFYGAAFFAALTRRFSKRLKLVITYHMIPRASGLRGLLFALHGKLLERFILNAADMVFTASLDYAMHHHIHHKALRYLPFGVDLKKFYPAETNDPHDNMRLLFVGGLDEAHDFKGVDVLLSAISELREEAISVSIVGDGDLRSTYERMAQSLGIEKKVHFLGRVDDVPQVFRDHDVHILPSKHSSEAYGLVTLEAAASGLPSIVSRLPGVRDLVREGVTGLAIEPGSVSSLAEALRSLLSGGSEQMKRMGDAARERAKERFSLQNEREQLRSYLDMLK